MVGKLGGLDIVRPVLRVHGLVAEYVVHEIASCAVLQGPFEPVPEREFEQGRKALIVRSRLVRLVEHLPDHVEVP